MLDLGAICFLLVYGLHVEPDVLLETMVHYVHLVEGYELLVV